MVAVTSYLMSYRNPPLAQRTGGRSFGYATCTTSQTADDRRADIDSGWNARDTERHNGSSRLLDAGCDPVRHNTRAKNVCGRVVLMDTRNGGSRSDLCRWQQHAPTQRARIQTDTALDQSSPGLARIAHHSSDPPSTANMGAGGR